ncbi:hypothetical protein F441_09631 [Phytophthora nicotianae CJ01A1]|uniref:AP2/ERF domain-containing protein n=1 Tax=Phytophthora nicotianae CJ01A1 TaxID=1317063 RepID=W2WZT2_PHYNI|nr:hypothetical protein F441_09631 [Phytophthora nicotianae CJ01A1]
MHRTALRGLYGGNNYHKSKSQAVISPVVDDMDTCEDGDLSRGEEGNGFGVRSNVSLRRSSNNAMDTAANMHGAAVALKIHDVPEDAEYPLQRKSATLTTDAGMLSRLGVGQFFGDRSSNQDQESFAGAPIGQKYTVLGQKQQWRKNRASRSRQLHTISPVDDDNRAVRVEGDTYSSGRGSTIPSSTSSYSEGRSSRAPSSAEPFSEGTSSLQSNSSGRDNEYSHGRSQCEGSSAEDNQRFVVTKQRKSKYAAKLHLNGQKPLYLGRYKNEEAALAACESAYSVISTPRK